MFENVGMAARVEAVEARLIEAWGFLMRMPDRERGWMGAATMTIWWHARMSEREAREQYQIDGDDYHAGAVRGRIGLRAVEVSRMDEALDWLDHVRPADRKLIGMALRVKAAGHAAVPWEMFRRELRWEGTGDALRKRYARALYRITHALGSQISATSACQSR